MSKIGEKIVKSLKNFANSLINGDSIKVTKVSKVDTPDGPMHVRKTDLYESITKETGFLTEEEQTLVGIERGRIAQKIEKFIAEIDEQYMKDVQLEAYLLWENATGGTPVSEEKSLQFWEEAKRNIRIRQLCPKMPVSKEESLQFLAKEKLERDYVRKIHKSN